MNKIIKGEALSELLEAGALWNSKFMTREKRSEQRQMERSIQKDKNLQQNDEENHHTGEG